MFHTPILFLVFNRPDTTQIVFNEIKKQKPKYLYVYADGPRKNNENDVIKCAETRAIFEKQIDWDCDLKLFFNDNNLGCGKGPAYGITWFFNNVEEGIIIEDDCVPHPDFFYYCHNLLTKYRSFEKVMVIGGTTYRDDYPCENSYTFSIYGTMAAWATWKRVWDKFDFNLAYVNKNDLKVRLKKYLHSDFEYKKWLSLYDWMLSDGFSDYWDWQLQFLMFYNEGVAIRPKRNMIRNIGIGTDATHTTTEKTDIFAANRATFGCLPLIHPNKVSVDKKIDAIFFKRQFRKPLTCRLTDNLGRVFRYFWKIIIYGTKVFSNNSKS